MTDLKQSKQQALKVKRDVFFVSDGTGITAESLGDSLLSQFGSLRFHKKTVPFVDNLDKVREVVTAINASYDRQQQLPIVFDTLVNRAFRAELAKAKAFFIDIFGTFLQPLERELQAHSRYRIGKTHGIQQLNNYKMRIDAINFSLDNDDGRSSTNYGKADLILIGVSRSGKTPTSLYLALQFGLHVANYPLTEEDLRQPFLPEVLRAHKSKLFGLTIDAERLAAIRQQRYPGSTYASLQQCRKELGLAMKLYNQENILFLASTDQSIEEISSRILVMTGIKRR